MSSVFGFLEACSYKPVIPCCIRILCYTWRVYWYSIFDCYVWPIDCYGPCGKHIEMYLVVLYDLNNSWCDLSTWLL